MSENVSSTVEIEYEEALNNYPSDRKILDSQNKPNIGMFTKNYMSPLLQDNASNIGISPDDLKFSNITLVTRKNESFILKRDSTTHLINEITAFNPNIKMETIQNISSPLKRKKILFDSPLTDPDFWRKLHVGHTPFTDRFRNSPLCYSRNRFKVQVTFNKPYSRFPLSDNEENQTSTPGLDSILRLVKYKSGTNVDRSGNPIFRNEYVGYIKQLFRTFFHLNERSIILRVVDYNITDKPDQDGSFNEKYISAYNCFHLFATFTEVVKMDTYKGIEFYRAKHRFDSQQYCLKSSCINMADIKSLNKSGRLLLNEIQTLSRLKHQHILRYYSCWIEYQSLFEQVEYNNGGSLETVVYRVVDNQLESRVLTLSSAKQMVLQIGSALDYLHSTWKIVHSDVAAYNILLFCATSSVHALVVEQDEEESDTKENAMYPVVYKLGGFGNSRNEDHAYQAIRDVQELATVAAEAVGEKPSHWAYTSPSKPIKMLQHSDNEFIRVLVETVLGRVWSAKTLLELVRDAE